MTREINSKAYADDMLAAMNKADQWDNPGQLRKIKVVDLYFYASDTDGSYIGQGGVCALSTFSGGRKLILIMLLGKSISLQLITLAP